MGRERGKVVTFKRTFGFIQRETGGADLFVHFTAIECDEDGRGFRTLVPGDQVTYEVGTDNAGRPRAASVRVDVS
jgi:CspA family cold shock protein